MNLFNSISNDINYQDVLQVDGSISSTHINYGKSPFFNGIDGKTIAEKSREHSLSSKESVDLFTILHDPFNGTEKNYCKDDQISLWKCYWLEYINAFDKLLEVLPDSIVTVYVGRHAIELGFKYLLFKKTSKLEYRHDLSGLSEQLLSKYGLENNYLEWIDTFCKGYSEKIEGGFVEYFRYPEYRASSFFAGNRLNVPWVSYNFALILLKLLHLANLEQEFQ